MKNWQVQLKNIPKEYRPAPFWSWNDTLNKEELLRQIADMDEKGFGGFFIHGRAGLTTEYLSDEWFDFFRVCIEEAKKREMYVWIYDENGWPSGFAGGKLLKREDFHVSGVKYAISKEWDENATASFVRNNGTLKRVFYPFKKATYIHIYIFKNSSYVDLCNPEVTDEFIRETHEKYYERFASEFGKTIKGIFTDEPQYFRNATPYSPMLEGYFKENYGEDVTEKLPLLFVDGAGAKQFRFRYYSALNELLANNYFKKVYDWCELHGCMLTGHAIDERCFSGQMNCSANVMPFYEYMQMPGIDNLGRFGTGTRIAKQAYSVAKQTGRKQLLTETFAMSGWDVTFKELRWIAETQYVGGANFLCQHLYPYSIGGIRRYDHPCMFSPCNPWWDKFSKFNEYFSRLSYMLAESKEKSSVAVLHTVKSAYLNWEKPNGYNSIMDEEDGINLALCQLFGYGVQFDILDEALLKNRGKIDGNNLVVGECKYKTLVLPYCTALEASTVAFIQKFIKNGGKLFVYYSSPIRVDGSDETVSFYSNITFPEILSSAEFCYTAYSEKVLSTYRRAKEGDFAYIVNRDEAQLHKLAVKIRGMETAEILDMFTLKTMPLCVQGETVYLDVKEAGSVVLLINACETNYRESFGLDSVQKPLQTMGTDLIKIGEFVPVYRFPKENYITLDKAAWSVDNIHYSEPILVYDIQSNMLDRRYDGELYLKYTLNVENQPKALKICFDYEALAVMVNGVEVPTQKEKRCTVADINKYMQFGKNEIVVKTEFYQRPYVYDVLFGDDTTESLINCLYFDTQLTELYVSGSFYVKAQNCVPHGSLYRADDFAIDGKFPAKQCGDTVIGGLPFYRGSLEYTLETKLEEDGEYEIVFQGRFATLEAYVNNETVQDILFGNSFIVNLKAGLNTIRAVVYSGNRNAYGPFHLSKEDVSVSPATYTCQSKYLPTTEYDLDHYYFTRFGIIKMELKKL